MAYTDIDDPSAYFQTTLYTGNASAGHAITNSGNSDLAPNWVWIKSRDQAYNHRLFDVVRGAGKKFLLIQILQKQQIQMNRQVLIQMALQ